MRNVWKGMIVGALTGAVAGLGLEAAEGSAKKVGDGAARASEAVAARIPDAKAKVGDAATNAAQALSERAPQLLETGKEAASTIGDALRTDS